jgi:BirA family biotin operon repressor/biotin-[acetyl-CoA-carboxylase] ligase
MSLIVRGLDERDALLPIAAALAVCDACEREGGATQGCRIKWPNDVWIDGRKVAGILIEGRPQEDWAVIGIGLNVDIEEQRFPDDLRERATSLLIASGSPDPGQMTGALLRYLDARLAQEPPQLLADYRRRDALLGRRVRWKEGEGTAAGIDDSGALLVETEGGTIALGAGEVHLL